MPYTRKGLLLIVAAALALNGCSEDKPASTRPVHKAPAVGDFPSRGVLIMAPAGLGGGWDSTARAMERALESGASSQHGVEVVNVEGAGGTVGLAQFVSQGNTDPHRLIVMGLVMVGAIAANQSPVTLDDVTPIAALTSEAEAIVVPAQSKYLTIGDLVDDFKNDPQAFAWAGGSAGGADQILVGLLAEKAGIDPAHINYTARSGGGLAIATLLSGGVHAAVSSVSEFKEEVAAGRLRLLAVSSEARLPGVAAPTLKETGFGIVFSNWRGLMAPAGISDAERAALVRMLQTMHASDEWQKTLRSNGWGDFFVAGDAFADFLREDKARVESVLQQMRLT